MQNQFAVRPEEIELLVAPADEEPADRIYLGEDVPSRQIADARRSDSTTERGVSRIPFVKLAALGQTVSIDLGTSDGPLPGPKLDPNLNGIEVNLSPIVTSTHDRHINPPL